jgi:hypothetical protein
MHERRRRRVKRGAAESANQQQRGKHRDCGRRPDRAEHDD